MVSPAEALAVGTTIKLDKDRDNINLSEGRLLIRFQPQWDSTDTQTRYALQTRLPRGRLSVAKIDDGRLLLTLVDKHDRQHHCWMDAPVETSPKHGLHIPGQAGIVVDDLKIWGPAG